ncbi:hypothetical protein Flavo103_08180 [Flavobacterium collinsii]|uniref:hypothetical protein n=1 Tax=Flavobacterium collinsii TaxID=1114861 RepID=UPI0022CB5087|nr:hypothetical protein [Flavobacterium collinsii]GIQ57682.1 hypothetical protein Flavo103_08180 [Flavobacterium collinsii]
MKIKTLNVTFMVIAYLISIPLQGFFWAIIGLKTHYLLLLFSHFIFFFFLVYLFTGTIIIDFNNDKDTLTLEWDKKPIYTKIENQVILLSEIKSWKFFNGRGADRLKIYFNNGESLIIDFNNLIDLRENSKKVDQLLFFLNTKNSRQQLA